MYEQATDIVNRAGLEISRPARGEFLIGDTPAITVDHARRLIGVRSGVPLGSANTVVLPLGSTHLAALAKDNAWQTMPAEMVTEVNRWQIIQANRQVYYHPRTQDFDSFVPSRSDLLHLTEVPRELTTRLPLPVTEPCGSNSTSTDYSKPGP